MTTLIAVYNSEGCVGRCDARCYNATSGHCDCVCGGANHGAGLDKALDNTRAYAETWLEAARAANPEIVASSVNTDTPPKQLALGIGA